MSDERTLRSQFQLLDRDTNGEVTAAELLHTVTELGLALSDEEVRNAWNNHGYFLGRRDNEGG